MGPDGPADQHPGDGHPPDAIPGSTAQPSNRPIDEMVASVPLDLAEDASDEIIEQQNVGRDQSEGGGEWPHPATPPSDAAPGSAGLTGPPRKTGRRQFADAQEEEAR